MGLAVTDSKPRRNVKPRVDPDLPANFADDADGESENEKTRRLITPISIRKESYV
jgi:hypothetical protein